MVFQERDVLLEFLPLLVVVFVVPPVQLQVRLWVATHRDWELDNLKMGGGEMMI